MASKATIIMNRISRLTTETQRANFALAHHVELTHLLKRFFPTKYHSLFAVPQIGENNAIEWYSELSGYPTPLLSLEPDEAQRIRRNLNERLNDIATLALQQKQLGNITESELQLLNKAAILPEDDSILIINDQPVITWWPRITPLAEPIAPAVPLSPTTIPTTAAVAISRRLWPRILLSLLLLLFILLLIFWLKGCFDPRVAPVATIEKPSVETIAQLPELVSKPEPETVPVSETIELTPLDQCIQELTADHSDPQAKSICTSRLQKPAKDLCPAERSPQSAPQVILIFDASGSMSISMNITQRELDMLSQGLIFNGYDREPSRISVARNAATKIVKNIPSDMMISAVVASDCGVIKTTPNYNFTQRPTLLNYINRIQPDAGTPLAEALVKAGSLIKNNQKDTIMILISDGFESCNKDPCTTAKQLKKAHPRMVVNVIDIMGVGAGNCIATSTGGKVFTAKNAKEVSVMMNKAIEDYIPKDCR